MTPTTPKFKSKAFKAALKGLKEVFDAQSLGVVLVDALERRSSEQIYAKLEPSGKSPKVARGSRLKDIKKTDLVGQITAHFFANDEVAFQTMRELDRACAKERHIVASIPINQASERIGSYRAIALKRERAKFVWALARDERGEIRELANRIIGEFFKEAAEFETARAVLDGREDSSKLKDLELAKRLADQAERLTEAAQKVSVLESKVSQYESERARLLVQMGAKERSLKQESEVRGEMEEQLSQLRQSFESVEQKQREAIAARKSEEEARSMAEELAQKVRRLSKLAGASKNLSATQEELEKSKRKVESLEKKLSQKDEEIVELKTAQEAEATKHRGEVESFKEEIKNYRKRIAELERKVSLSPEEGEGPEPGSTAVLLDQANLAATAFMSFRRKVNFAAILEQLRAGRKITKAVAFVVDNGGTGFDAFCDTLRKAGWDLRIKKPKTFQDGQTKADWDMGMAMEAVDLRGQVETLVLASGDGDFSPLLRQLKRYGMKVEVAAYSDALAIELVNAADSITRLGSSTLE